MIRKPAITVIVGIISAASLQAQTASPSSARLGARSGIVEVQRNNTWSPIAAGDPISAGDRIRTASGSLAALELGPGKTITLSPSTEIQLRDPNGTLSVQLVAGNMKVFSAADIQVAANDTVLEGVKRPVDMQVGLQGDRLDVMVRSGAVKSGAMTIRGAEDTSVRMDTADGPSPHRRHFSSDLGAYPTFSSDPGASPTFYVYPYIIWGNAGAYGNAGNGAIVPPTVLNPTHPGYRPEQIVPPMSDPIRVPIQRR